MASLEESKQCQPSSLIVPFEDIISQLRFQSILKTSINRLLLPAMWYGPSMELAPGSSPKSPRFAGWTCLWSAWNQWRDISVIKLVVRDSQIPNSPIAFSFDLKKITSQSVLWFHSKHWKIFFLTWLPGLSEPKVFKMLFRCFPTAGIWCPHIQEGDWSFQAQPFHKYVTVAET